MRSIDALPDRHWTVWRPAGGFTKNPDVVRLPSGRLLCVYNQTDVHWPTTSQITLLGSDDDGRTWTQQAVLDTGDKRRGEEVWITPRLTRLRDGRLVVCCDQNDFAHCHEDSPPGIYTWWSEDDGRTWSERRPTGIPGIEPDRVVELADGTLIMGTHFTSRDTVRLTEALAFSRDGGRSWGDLVVTGKDAVHNFCEGAYVELPGGALLCAMRENTSAGGREHNLYPSFVTCSLDGGRTWTRPVEAPFWGDRPFGGLLSSGKLLVTYRNVGSRLGLYAWRGDPLAALSAGFQPALRRLGGAQIALHDGALRLAADTEQVAQYTLLPPEDYRSSVTARATLRVVAGGGDPDAPAASLHLPRSGYTVRFFPDRVQINTGARLIERAPLDGGSFHEYQIEAHRGRFRLLVDGEVRLQHLYTVEAPRSRAYFGSAPGDAGVVEWRALAYHVRNETEPEHFWAWSAAGGALPNQHEQDCVLEVEAHVAQDGWRDLGYSSWVELPDGRIFVADYTNNGGDESPPSPTRKAYLRGTYLYESDFGDAPAQA